MQRDRTDELDVVRDHVPGLGLSRHRHGRVEETAARFLDGREHLWKDFLEDVTGFLHQPVIEIGQGFLQLLPLERILGMALLSAKLFDLVLDLSSSLGDVRPGIRPSYP